MKKSCLLILLLLSFLLLQTGCSDGGDSDGDIDGDTDGDITEAEDEISVDGDDDTIENAEEETAEDIEQEAEAEEESGPVSLIDYVDPFIGTGGAGFNVGSGFPGATAPFGMLKVSPDTSPETGPLEYFHCGGYYADDNYMYGFSHTHLYGVGISEYGNFLVIPTYFDETLTNPFMVKKTRSYFDKETEVASPGYYSVILDDHQIKAELTATERAAHHRYTYPESNSSKPADVYINFSSAITDGEVLGSSLKIDKANNKVEGWALQKGSFSGRYGGIDIYFVAQFNKPIQSFITRNADTIENEVAEQNGTEIGAVLTFDVSDNNKLEMQAAISFVSMEQAWLNLETEMPKWDFDGTHQATRDKWEEQMSIFTLYEGGTEEDKVKMATSLFHLFMAPNIFNDVNGKYIGFDDQIHETDSTYYTDFSMWDTYRTYHPLLTLTNPELTLDFVNSLLLMAKQGGNLPKWPQGKGYTGCMVSSPADVVIADAYLKGVTDFDEEFAFDKMVEHGKNAVANASREDIEYYVQNGYVRADKTGGSASKTMEHTIADYAIYQMAKELGETEEADYFKQSSKNYTKIWDPAVKFFRGKNEDGTWQDGEFTEENFDAIMNHKYYTEGNAWQYLWLVPHDMAGLMELIGGSETMTERLNYLFTEAETFQQYLDDNPDDLVARISPPAYYWHGNEPDIHASYMFLQSGRPDLTQKWVHWISSKLYHTKADGIPGNDDCGTLSAWYIFSSMGFYPIPGSTMYLVGRPLFKLMEIKTTNGVLRIEAPNAGGENIYVQNVKLNGEDLTVPYFDHNDIKDGGTLYFEMGSEPSNWGKVATIPQYEE